MKKSKADISIVHLDMLLGKQYEKRVCFSFLIILLLKYIIIIIIW